MSYIMRREQWIARPIEEVFAFFADAHNLEEITPPWLGFKILSMSTDSISEGTMIRYRLRLHGIPIHWGQRSANGILPIFRRRADKGPISNGVTRTV